jgi:RHS repeat-associated protein
MAYTYDALGRLTSAVSQGSTNYPKWGLSFSYDRYGNRLSQTVTAGTAPSNSVSVDATTNHINTAGYGYDANGNMTNDGANTLTYDAENRVVSSADGSGTATYSYDGSNLRVQKSYSGTTTVYIFSGNKVLDEYANGTLSEEYIYRDMALFAEYAGSTLLYHGHDQVSDRINMDGNGNVVGSQGHYPFGEDWYMNSTTTKWHFTTYERDAESSNDYARFRFHVNRLGRFSSTDPVCPRKPNPQLQNRYSSVANDPIDHRDVNGRDLFEECDPTFDFCCCDPFFGCDCCDMFDPMCGGGGGGGGGGCGDFGCGGGGGGGGCDPTVDPTCGGGGGGGGCDPTVDPTCGGGLGGGCPYVTRAKCFSHCNWVAAGEAAICTAISALDPALGVECILEVIVEDNACHVVCIAECPN